VTLATWYSTSAFVILLLAASVFDLSTRRVPNWLVVLVLGVGIAVAMTGATSYGAFRSWILGCGVGLLLWLPLWLLGMLGAGDVKFFAAASGWIGPTLSWRAAVLAALLGGVMAVAMLAYRWGLRNAMDRAAVHALHQGAFLRAAVSTQRPQSGDTIPYAVPMSVALAIAWFFPEFLRSLV
jgi:prepilin peptidase CpaA